MPDLAEQDDRRALGAPARRAGLLPAAIAAIVVTGPSGVGKGTLIRSLLEQRPDLTLSISATTRDPRRGEENGVDYYFLDGRDFDLRVEAGDFLEHAEYAGNRYGTLRSEIARAEIEGADLVLEIEIQGARQVRDTLPEALQVFIAPPSEDALRSRLVGRGTDDPDAIDRRLRVAREEMAAEEEFPHSVCNDRLEDAVGELVALVDTMRA